MRAIIKRFIAEFWIGLVVGLFWALFRNWPFRVEIMWVGNFLGSLAAGFFFTSWFTGQFVRISRQFSVETKLGTLLSQLEGVTASVGRLTTRVNEVMPSTPAPVATELRELTSTANAQLAQANSTAAEINSWLVTGWQPPPRTQMPAGVLDPASNWIPTPQKTPTWPPDSPKSTGGSI